MHSDVLAGNAPARRVSLPVRVTLPAFAGAVAYVATLFFLLVPHVFVQDTWSTLVAGREVARHGLPSVEHLTVLAAGRSWVDQQWLAQVIFYGASSVAGLKGVALVQLAACIVAFAFLMRSAYVRGASAPSIAGIAFFALAAAPWAFQIRAQGLAIALCGVVLALLLGDQEGMRARTWLVFPLLCLWANVHGSVVLGALLVVVYGVLTWRNSVRSAVFVLLPPLTTLASPYAFKLPGYYHLMLIDPPFAGLNVEWQRTTPRPITAVFFALVALAAVTLVWKRRRLSRLDVALLAITLASALLAVRGIVWFALVCVAVLPPALSRRRDGEPRPKETLVVIGAFVVLFISVVGFLASPVDTTQSTALADVVARAAGKNGTVFADDKRADWILWREPSLRGRVAYDVRFELLRRSEIKRLSQYVYFDPRGFPSVTRGFRVVVGDRKHVTRLASKRGLRVVFSSKDGTVAAPSATASGTRPKLAARSG